LGEKLPDRGEKTGIGRRVGAWSSSDRGLVDVDDFVDLVDAPDLLAFPGAFP
jgi:hypothetical protein